MRDEDIGGVEKLSNDPGVGPKRILPLEHIVGEPMNGLGLWVAALMRIEDQVGERYVEYSAEKSVIVEADHRKRDDPIAVMQACGLGVHEDGMTRHQRLPRGRR